MFPAAIAAGNASTSFSKTLETCFSTASVLITILDGAISVAGSDVEGGEDEALATFFNETRLFFWVLLRVGFLRRGVRSACIFLSKSTLPRPLRGEVPNVPGLPPALLASGRVLLGCATAAAALGNSGLGSTSFTTPRPAQRKRFLQR